MTAINSKAPPVLMVICALGCGGSTKPAANPDGPPGFADSGWVGAAGSGGTTGVGGAAGSGGIGGAAGSGGADQPDASARGDGPAPATQCLQVPAKDRACTTVADCSLVLHQIDCCGNEVALGVSASARARVESAERNCRISLGLCECPVGPTRTDDGSRPRDPGEIVVACTAGQCTTYRRGCGSPCPAGTSCFDCPETNRTGYYCSVACTSSDGCAGAPHPICSEQTSPRFCAPAICGTRS